MKRIYARFKDVMILYCVYSLVYLVYDWYLVM